MSYQPLFYITVTLCCMLVVERIYAEYRINKMQNFLMYHKDADAFNEVINPAKPFKNTDKISETEQQKKDYDRILREGVISDVDMEKFELQEPIIQ